MKIESAPGKGTTITLICPAGDKIFISKQDRMDNEQSRIDDRTAAPEIIRIMLADDHRVVREGLRGILEEQADLEVIGEASDGASAIEMAERLLPDVILMDINMPGINGIEATRSITERQPQIHIIGLSVHDSSDMAQRMIEAGAIGYIHKTTSQQALCDAIRRTMGTLLDNKH
jgi:DNA-binding NarL/FixJ family response regulator